jgi:transcriptional regulator
MNPKGSLPLLILHTLSRGPGHGYQIAKEIKQGSQGTLDFKEGTLYPTLHNLEEQGLVESYDAEVNGRARRCYRLTENGRDTLATERQAWEQYSTAVNAVLREEAAS